MQTHTITTAALQALALRELAALQSRAQARLERAQAEGGDKAVILAGMLSSIADETFVTQGLQLACVEAGDNLTAMAIQAARIEAWTVINDQAYQARMCAIAGWHDKNKGAAPSTPQVPA